MNDVTTGNPITAPNLSANAIADPDFDATGESLANGASSAITCPAGYTLGGSQAACSGGSVTVNSITCTGGCALHPHP